MRKFSWLLILTILIFSLGCTSNRSLFERGSLEIPNQNENFDILVPTLQSNNLLFVWVEIGGKKYKFLFDTGAPMVISKELQAEFDFEVKTQAQVKDSQNQRNIQRYVQIDSLSLAGLVFKDLVAVEADLRYSPILACLNIDGLIGANLMRQCYWEMDAQSGYLRMSSSPEKWPLADKRLISKSFKVKNTFTPVLELRVANTLHQNITFDSGSSDLLSLGKTANDAYQADSVLFKAYGYLSAGLFGSIIDTLEVQDLSLYLDSLPYHCPIEFEANKDARLLGMDFFRHFRVFMDWRSQKMHFLPHDTVNFWQEKSFPTAPFIQGEAIIIGQLNSIASAEAQELALGDTIEKINDISFYPASADDYCRVIELFKENEQLNLEIRNKGLYRIRRQLKFPEKQL